MKPSRYIKCVHSFFLRMLTHIPLYVSGGWTYFGGKHKNKCIGIMWPEFKITITPIGDND